MLLTKPDMSAAEQVQEAVVCLLARLEATLDTDVPSLDLREQMRNRDLHNNS